MTIEVDKLAKLEAAYRDGHNGNRAHRIAEVSTDTAYKYFCKFAREGIPRGPRQRRFFIRYGEPLPAPYTGSAMIGIAIGVPPTPTPDWIGTALTKGG